MFPSPVSQSRKAPVNSLDREIKPYSLTEREGNVSLGFFCLLLFCTISINAVVCLNCHHPYDHTWELLHFKTLCDFNCRCLGEPWSLLDWIYLFILYIVFVFLCAVVRQEQRSLPWPFATHHSPQQQEYLHNISHTAALNASPRRVAVQASPTASRDQSPQSRVHRR